MGFLHGDPEQELSYPATKSEPETDECQALRLEREKSETAVIEQLNQASQWVHWGEAYTPLVLPDGCAIWERTYWECLEKVGRGWQGMTFSHYSIPDLSIAEIYVSQGGNVYYNLYRFSDDPIAEPWMYREEFIGRVVERYGEKGHEYKSSSPLDIVFSKR